MIEAAGREVRLSNPSKVYFPRPGWTKLDLATYYLETEQAVTTHLRERPTVMKRFVNGILEEPIWQKRVPQNVPEYRRGARRQRRRPSRVGGQPRRDRLQPVAGAARRPRPSGRAARGPRPHARRGMGRRAADRPRGPRRARGARPARLSEDVGIQGDPRQRARHTRVGLAGGTARRARARA